jgi:cytochrome c-type biogenesis protein
VSPDPVASIGWLLAFGAGLLSFFSPCVVPIVPGYLSLISGVAIGAEPASRRQMERVVLSSILFVLGFGTVFVALGAASSLLGGLLGGLFDGSRPLLIRAAGALMIVMGLVVVGVIRVPLLARDYRVQFVDRAYGPVGVVAIGMAFGIGWTPCIGPILASILVYAGTAETAQEGAILLLLYSAGLGIPFIASAVVLSRAVSGLAWVRRHLPTLNAISGTVLVLLGGLFLFNQAYLLAYLSAASQRLLEPLLR